VDEGRRETSEERDDRRFDDALQELRVVQTSAQLTAGFLLTLPFQQRFATLSTFQHRCYLVLVVLATLVTVVVLTPVAVHRRLTGELMKGRVVATTQVMMQVALAALALLAVGIVAFVFDVVTDHDTTLVVAGTLLATVVGLHWVLPSFLRLSASRASRGPSRPRP